MSIKHAFTSAKSDSADPSIVNASNWNDVHTIDDATITLAKIANVSATKRVLGRNSAGAGVPEEVTASQLFDWTSSTNGVLLTRTGGTWAALANVTTDNGDLVFADNATPVAPSSSTVKLHSLNIAGKSLLAQKGAVGLATALQPHFGRNKVGRWEENGAAAYAANGISAPAVIGTNTARNPASTNLFTSMRRAGQVSAAGAGNIASLFPNSTRLQFWRGNAAGLGGFTAIFRFGISDASLVATANMFVGMRATTMTDVAPSTIANCLGVGCDSGDTVLQLYAAGSAAQARVSLGASFPVNTVNTDVYELALYAAPNDTVIKYLVTRVNTGDTASGTISVSANLIATSQFMGPLFGRSNGGTAVAVGIDFMGLYVETDY